MLSVERSWRRRGIGMSVWPIGATESFEADLYLSARKLVEMTIDAMREKGADEVSDRPYKMILVYSPDVRS